MTMPYRMNDTMMPKKEKASHLQYTNPWSGVSCSASPLEPAIAAGVAGAQRRRRKRRCQAQTSARRHASGLARRHASAALLQWPRRRVLGYSAPGDCAVANSSIAAMNRCFACARSTASLRLGKNRQLFEATRRGATRPNFHPYAVPQTTHPWARMRILWRFFATSASHSQTETERAAAERQTKAAQARGREQREMRFMLNQTQMAARPR